MRPRVLSCGCALFVSLGVSGCKDDTKVDASSVFRLSHCPKDATCDLVADGRSTVTVEVCLAPEVTEPAPDLSVSLTLSTGAWVNATDPTNAGETEVRLSGDGCALPSFITGTIADVVRIDAELSGFTLQDFVRLAPAPLDALEVVPMPPRLSEGTSNEIGLNVSVRAKGIGKPSAGTRVSFSVIDKAPENVAVLFYPQKTLMDPATGTASTAVEILGSVKSVKVLVTATGPEGKGGTPGASISEELALEVIPSM